MSRIPELAPDALSPEQKRVRDEIASARSGQARGPFGIWLRVPRIADAANKLGNSVRKQSNFEPRLFELMVLVCARAWSANYAWGVHAKAGTEAGLAPAVIEAIRTRRKPEFQREDERLIYETISELVEKRALSQPAYERALNALGQEMLIELIAAAGFYTMVGMTLAAFDVEATGGGRPLA
jgi:4-carboxymuconolactone decarboxylase